MKTFLEFALGLAIAIAIAAVVIPLFVAYMAILSLFSPEALALGTIGGFVLLMVPWCWCMEGEP